MKQTAHMRRLFLFRKNHQNINFVLARFSGTFALVKKLLD
jgi:hypothetical protein